MSYLKSLFYLKGKLVEFTTAFLTKLVSFLPDPKAEEKQAHRLENPVDEETLLETSLEPSPRFDQWEYQQILEHGVRPLADIAPYQVANILINATASMIRLRKHQEDLNKEGEEYKQAISKLVELGFEHQEDMDKERDEDYSEIWCSRLNQSNRKHPNSKETLIHTLTFACEKVYENSPESVEALDEALRNQRWKVFKRLRQTPLCTEPK